MAFTDDIQEILEDIQGKIDELETVFNTNRSDLGRIEEKLVDEVGTTSHLNRALDSIADVSSTYEECRQGLDDFRDLVRDQQQRIAGD